MFDRAQLSLGLVEDQTDVKRDGVWLMVCADRGGLYAYCNIWSEKGGVEPAYVTARIISNGRFWIR